jgi:hypothetical protein
MPLPDGSSPAPAGGENADEAKGDVLLPLPLPLPPAAFRMPDSAADEDEVDLEGSVTSRMSTIGHCDVPAKSLSRKGNPTCIRLENHSQNTGCVRRKTIQPQDAKNAIPAIHAVALADVNKAGEQRCSETGERHQRHQPGGQHEHAPVVARGDQKMGRGRCR